MKIKKNKYDVIINFISLLSLVGTVIFLIITWDKIPSTIPGHYNAAGEIDKLSNKSSLIFLLVTGWILYLGISLVEKFPSIWNTGVTVTEENKQKVYRILKDMIGSIKLLIALVFSYLTLQSTTGDNLSPFFLPAFVILMFGSLAFHLIRLFKAK